MSDERSERLRSRRNETAEKAEAVKQGKPDKSDPPVKPEDNESEASDKPDKSVKPDSMGEPDERDNTVTPVKQRENWGPKQIHLPEQLEEEMEIVLDETNVRMRRAGEDPLEKLMHWYPLVVQQGIDGIEAMDVDEIQERIRKFETEE